MLISIINIKINKFNLIHLLNLSIYLFIYLLNRIYLQLLNIVESTQIYTKIIKHISIHTRKNLNKYTYIDDTRN